jgi:hypothetical protein
MSQSGIEDKSIKGETISRTHDEYLGAGFLFRIALKKLNRSPAFVSRLDRTRPEARDGVSDRGVSGGS